MYYNLIPHQTVNLTEDWSQTSKVEKLSHGMQICRLGGYEMNLENVLKFRLYGSVNCTLLGVWPTRFGSTRFIDAFETSNHIKNALLMNGWNINSTCWWGRKNNIYFKICKAQQNKQNVCFAMSVEMRKKSGQKHMELAL